ncbi:MAG TPA: hypothetical protein VFB34_03830 [Chloroflexota bacterium]|nr:hypothetical protein [Chloroflexota bacterium]
MSRDSAPNSSVNPINVAAGGVGVGLLLAGLAVAYMRSQKQPKSKLAEALNAAASGGNSAAFKRKMAINTAIKLIENDLTRKALIAGLKAVLKRRS